MNEEQVASRVADFDVDMKGKVYRKARGTVLYTCEGVWVDDSYARHFDFIGVYYRMRSGNTHKTELVDQYSLKYGWVVVDG